MAYTALYKSYGQTLDEIKASDVTVTLIRETKPEGLFRYLNTHDYQITNPYNGIYYIDGKIMFPTQIIVTGELNKKEHIWLSSLSNKMKKQDMQELFNQIQQLENTFDIDLADSVLEVSIGANKEVVKNWKGDDTMCNALMEIMEPEIRLREKELEEAALQRGMQRGIQQGIQQGMQQGIQQGMQQGIQQGMQQGIQAAIDMLRTFGHRDEEIKLTLMNKYNLSTEETEKYFP